MDKSKLAVTLAVVILSVNLLWSIMGVFGVLGVPGHGCRVWYDVATDMCAAVRFCSLFGAVSRENCDVL